MYAAARSRGARLVDGHHPARARRRQRRRDREPRARARQRRAAGRGAHADPRPLGRAGRRGDGRVRHRVPRWRSSRTPRTPLRSPSEYGFADRRPARASPPRRWSRPAAAARSTCSTRAAATSSTCCPSPTWSTPRSRVSRCACTRTSCVQPDARRARRGRRAAARVRRATSSAAAAPRPPPSGASRSAPRSPVRASGEARSEWEIFADLARRVAPERAEQCTFASGAGDPRRDRSRRARVRGSRAPAHHRGRDPVGRHPALRRRRLPDARRPRRTSPRSRRREVDVPDGQLRAQHPPRQAVQLDGVSAEGPAHRRGARRAVHRAVRRRARSALRDGDRVLVRSDHGEMRARVHLAPDPARQRAGVLPRRQRAAAAPAAATRRRACPTTTRSSPWRPRRSDTRRPARGVRRRGRRATRGARDAQRHPTGAPAPTVPASTPRPRRRRRHPAGAARRRPPRGERGVGLDRPRRRRRHRRARSRRRLHQLLTGHPVLGDLVVRARRRRTALRAGRRTTRPRPATPRCAGRARGSTTRRSHRRQPPRSSTRSSRSRAGRRRRCRGSSSAPSARRRSRCATSRPDGSTATSTAGASTRAVGLPRRLPRLPRSGRTRRGRRRRRPRGRSMPTHAASSSARARRNCSHDSTEGPVGDRRSRSRCPARGRSIGRPRPAARSCSTPSAARQQRAGEGPGRLGERRRHVERARDPGDPPRRRARPRVLRRGDRRRPGRRRVVRRPARRHRQLRARVPRRRRVGRARGRRPTGRRCRRTRRCSGACTRRASVAARPATANRSASASASREEAICATGFPFRSKRDRLPEYFPVFERALLTFEDLRRAGAASLDLSWTAAGVFDGYFELALGPWDVAAGGLLVREAGGVVTDWQRRRPGVAPVGRHRGRLGPGARAPPRGHRRRLRTPRLGAVAAPAESWV